MKTKMLSLVVLFMMGVFSVFAEDKTETIEVKGNCEECKIRIEKAALSVEGVSTAVWDLETKQLELVFDDTKTDLDKVEVAIAEVGHDTPKHKAADDVYNKLPESCKYRE